MSSIITEETNSINIGTTEIPRFVRISISLLVSQEEVLAKVLCENIGHFTWSYKDMLGLDLELVLHDLEVVKRQSQSRNF